MTEFPFEALEDADLVVGAVYRGGEGHTVENEPLHRLLGVGNVGGFRRVGPWEAPHFVVLYSSFENHDWPDSIDEATGVLTYYGDNKKASKGLLDTPLRGNRILEAAFKRLEGDRSGVPPFFVFGKVGSGRDMAFKGLAVPGGPGIESADALQVVKSWGSGGRFENYEAKFTILDESVIDRRWLEELRKGNGLGEHCPEAWRRWRLADTSTDSGVTSAPTAIAAVRVARPEGLGVSQEVDGEGALRERLELLRGLSFGGRQVAWAPGMEGLDRIPKAPPPAGAQEAIEWLQGRLQSEEAGQALLFLVGGPGNGKSYLTAGIVEDFPEINPRDTGRVYRTYEYQSRNRGLLLVNDATIGLRTKRGESLVGDIDLAMEDGRHVVVNVNRGVLVEELATTGDVGPGRAIVRWLNERHPVLEEVEIDAGSGCKLTPGAKGQYLDACTVTYQGRGVDVVAVFMDSVSLLEQRPTCEVRDEPGEVFVQPNEYKVAKFFEPSGATPAGDLFERIVDSPFSAPEGVGLDPISANFESLAQPVVRAGLMKVLRASEIMASSRLTYRDLWGVIGQTFLGILSERSDGKDPIKWLQEHQPPDGMDSMGRLKATLELAQLRFHQAVYMADGWAEDDEDYTVDSTVVSKKLRQADPARDLRPGWVGQETSGWSTPIVEAFGGTENHGSPLKGLEEAIGNDDDAAMVAITSFDRALDECIVGALDGDMGDSQKRSLLRWYGSYLARLYATAHGIPAFADEVDAWTRVWRKGKASERAPQGEFGRSLRTLLFPSYSVSANTDRRLLLPIFDSRVEPLIDYDQNPRLVRAIQGDTQPFQWTVEGDSIILNLALGGEKSVELDFDFAVVREALACIPEAVGATHQSHVADPRIERFRTALLDPAGAQGELCVVNGADIHPLEVEE